MFFINNSLVTEFQLQTSGVRSGALPTEPHPLPSIGTSVTICWNKMCH